MAIYVCHVKLSVISCVSLYCGYSVCHVAIYQLSVISYVSLYCGYSVCHVAIYQLSVISCVSLYCGIVCVMLQYISLVSSAVFHYIVV